MPILHQFKLMATNGFDILLILIEKGLKRDIAQLGKVFIEPSVGFGNNE